MDSTLELDDELSKTLNIYAEKKEKPESVAKQILFVSWQFRTAIIFWADLVTHAFIAIENPGNWEFYATLLAYCLEVMVLIEFARYSSRSNLLADITCILFGAYPAKSYLDRIEKCEAERGILKEKKMDLANINALVNVYTNESVDKSCAFHTAIVKSLIDVVKLHFFLSATTSCSLEDLTRFVLIISLTWDIVQTAVALEESESWCVRITNIYDYLYVNLPGDKIKQNLPSNCLAVFLSFISKTLSMFIVVISFFYFSASSAWFGLIFGLLGLLFGYLHHKTSPPVLENIPFGVGTKMYHFRETVASFLFLRNTRISKKNTLYQGRNYFWWHFKLWIQFAVTLLLTTLIDVVIPTFGTNRLNTHNDSHVECPVFPYGWVSSTFESTESYHWINLEVLIISMISLCILNLLYVFYLNGMGFVEHRFPLATAEKVWEYCFLATNNWKKKSTAHTILYLRKLFYLSVISLDEFNNSLKEINLRRTTWKELSDNESRSTGYANNTLPNYEQMINHLRLHPLYHVLKPILKFCQDVDVDQQDILVIRKLCFMFSNSYGPIMKNMSSRRIERTAEILNVDPNIDSRKVKRVEASTHIEVTTSL